MNKMNGYTDIIIVSTLSLELWYSSHLTFLFLQSLIHIRNFLLNLENQLRSVRRDSINQSSGSIKAD
jgi:hypothetical protein